jgi:hypothetical protein
MDRVRGHQISGTIMSRDFTRHYVTAAIAAVGVGLSAYGMLSAPSGKTPTPVRAQMAEQQRRSDEAYSLQQMLLPYQLDAIGLEPVFGAGGQITGVKKKAPTADEQQAAEIKRLANEKVLKGLRGELDIDPGATRTLNEADAQREEMLSRALGADYKISTAGQTARTKGAESRNITESAIRRGEMTAAEAIAQGRISNEQFNEQIALGLMGGAPGRASALALQDPLTAGQTYGHEYSAAAGRATGYAQLGSGLMRGAGALYGAMRGNQQPSAAYTPTVTAYNPDQPYTLGVEPIRG